jgi:hypothetical protein
VSAPGEYDNGEIGGMIGKGNRSTRRKPAPMPLCPPQTPYAALTRTRAAAVGSQSLTAELRHGPTVLSDSDDQCRKVSQTSHDLILSDFYLFTFCIILASH